MRNVASVIWNWSMTMLCSKNQDCSPLQVMSLLQPTTMDEHSHENSPTPLPSWALIPFHMPVNHHQNFGGESDNWVLARSSGLLLKCSEPAGSDHESKGPSLKMLPTQDPISWSFAFPLPSERGLELTTHYQIFVQEMSNGVNFSFVIMPILSSIY